MIANPCKCGGHAVIKQSAFRSPLTMEKPLYFAVCSRLNCPYRAITGVHKTEAEVIQEWNGRAGGKENA